VLEKIANYSVTNFTLHHMWLLAVHNTEN